MKEKSKYKEKEIFRVPDNYFEDLTKAILQKVSEEKLQNKPGLFTIARPHLMLAASMIVLAIISYATLRFVLPEFRQNDSFDNLEELTDYLAYEIDEGILLDNIDYSELEFSDLDYGHGLNDIDIIEYLANQNINYESLLENL